MVTFKFHNYNCINFFSEASVCQSKNFSELCTHSKFGVYHQKEGSAFVHAVPDYIILHLMSLLSTPNQGNCQPTKLHNLLHDVRRGIDIE
jgi:hypothetical protein